MIQENDKLKVISLPWIETTQNFARVLQLLGQLKDLEEIRLEWRQKISADDTLRALDRVEQSKTMNQITIIVRIHIDYNELIASIPKEWVVSSVEVNRNVKHATIVRML